MHIPPPLHPGAKVAVLATSGVCDPAKLAKGVGVLQSLGLVVQVMESCHASHDYLAGPDALRLRDLHTAFADKEIKAIFVARGGYGAARLLPWLDYAMIRQNPKIFVGFSDVTALHIVLNQFCKLATLHGPMPAACFGAGEIDPLTFASFKDALFGSVFFRFGTANLETLHPGGLYFSASETFGVRHANVRILDTKEAHTKDFRQENVLTGILTGGNLSVIASTLGTPYEIETRNRILFLEEVNEVPYRVDRLLLQLKLSGKLRDAAGIVFGDFSPETLQSLSTAVQELVLTEEKPTVWGLPCGHSGQNITLPLGRAVSIVTGHGKYLAHPY